ncbi:ABC transporter permease [uncultured Lacticaseibacillus sp.]|uniref:ABC transporter permease n=1 Tax=uncultured Lacticaseibacillus sp. TaxID=2775882 RepID=UPI0025928D31|nr:ABC transporter permease [uncultured Lacticaseibacillus sp.]
MFLALKEIKKEKLRSGLIIAMIVLISYLIFILTSLALGLAQQNTDAIRSWNVDKVVLNADANTDMRQSFLSQQQVGKLTSKEAYIGETTVVAKAKGRKQLSAVFIGLKADQFVAKNVQLTSGRRVRAGHEVVVDEAFKLAGYKLGSRVKLNADETKYTIVGFTKDAKLNIAPVVYGQLSTWRALRGMANGPVASAVVSRNADYKNGRAGTKTYTTDQIIAKLPGYQAQNTTFGMMIGFLMVISLVIIAVFLYILTMQKLPNYAVLRAQGIPSRVLVGATVSQSFILVVSGLIIGSLLAAVTALVVPAAVPMAFDIPALSGVAVALLVMAMLGALVPIKSVLSVDPVSVIGG